MDFNIGCSPEDISRGLFIYDGDDDEANVARCRLARRDGAAERYDDVADLIRSVDADEDIILCADIDMVIN